MLPTEEFEQVNLQTVQGQVPTKTSLWRKELVNNNNNNMSHYDSNHVSDNTDYLLQPVTLFVHGEERQSTIKTGNT